MIFFRWLKSPVFRPRGLEKAGVYCRVDMHEKFSLVWHLWGGGHSLPKIQLSITESAMPAIHQWYSFIPPEYLINACLHE